MRIQPLKSSHHATYFASPERAAPEDVSALVRRITESSILSSVLESLGGWVAILNPQRQVLALNHALLGALGVDEPEQVLGLRPGEVLKCVHAQDHPAGCGTSEFCATCGAAIAIVAAQENGGPQERECILSCLQSGEIVDRVFVIQASRIRFEDSDLVLISMRDISEEKRRAALERAFLHDISSLLSAIHIATGVLRAPPGSEDEELLTHIREAAATVIREVKVQKLLGRDDVRSKSVELEPVFPMALLSQVRTVLARHPAARGQEIRVMQPVEDKSVETDPALLLRVMTNMLVNALEAGGPGDEVRLGARATGNSVEFSVWNRQPVSPVAAMRMFQQYFSTKPGSGRGLGTFSMRLLGEKILGGVVSFTSTAEEGTTFRIRVPRDFATVPDSD